MLQWLKAQNIRRLFIFFRKTSLPFSVSASFLEDLISLSLGLSFFSFFFSEGVASLDSLPGSLSLFLSLSFLSLDPNMNGLDRLVLAGLLKFIVTTNHIDTEKWNMKRDAIIVLNMCWLCRLVCCTMALIAMYRSKEYSCCTSSMFVHKETC